MDGFNYSVSEQYVAACNEMIKELEEKVGKGVCKDFSDYKKVCGRIEGIKDSKTKFKDILRENVDEEEV